MDRWWPALLIVAGFAIAIPLTMWLARDARPSVQAEIPPPVDPEVQRQRIERERREYEAAVAEGNRRIAHEAAVRRARIESIANAPMLFGTHEPAVGHVGRLPICRVQQVLGPRDCLIEVPGVGTVWLTGYGTGRIVDDANIHPPGRWAIIGPETYTTVLGGSRTVWRLLPFSDIDAELQPR